MATWRPRFVYPWADKQLSYSRNYLNFQEPNFHCRVRKSAPRVPVLNQTQKS
jgi:hypothetical protein